MSQQGTYPAGCTPMDHDAAWGRNRFTNKECEHFDLETERGCDEKPEYKCGRCRETYCEEHFENHDCARQQIADSGLSDLKRAQDQFAADVQRLCYLGFEF